MTNEYETPNQLFMDLKLKYKISPKLDVCASEVNSKCENFIDKFENAITRENWKLNNKVVDCWMNPPVTAVKGENSGIKAFVQKAFFEWQEHRMNILSIVPVSAFSSKYFNPIWQDIRENGFVNFEIDPLLPRPKFILGGIESETPASNAYMVLVFRKTKRRIKTMCETMGELEK